MRRVRGMRIPKAFLVVVIDKERNCSADNKNVKGKYLIAALLSKSHAVKLSSDLVAQITG